MVIQLRKPLFALGELRITPKALECLRRAGIDPHGLVHRHVTGDWCAAPVDWMVKNDEAVRGAEKLIMSMYQIGNAPVSPGTAIVVATEADRSATTINIWQESWDRTVPLPEKTRLRNIEGPMQGY